MSYCQIVFVAGSYRNGLKYVRSISNKTRHTPIECKFNRSVILIVGDLILQYASNVSILETLSGSMVD